MDMSNIEEQIGISSRTELRDYNLLGAESILALERGLAEATWYATPVPRAKMRELLVRKNGPAIRDTLIWFSLIFGSGYLFYISWGHWWLIFPYIIYSTLYASTSDSRWHESSHGTAFKSAWMNNVLYEIASFMVFRQSIPWRWSHIRHHSDTIIRGRDPEIAVPRPPDIKGIIMQFFALRSVPKEFRKMVKHVFGKIDPAVATYLPASEYPKVFLRARIYFLIYAIVIGLSIYYSSILPLMFIGLPTLFGSWLMSIYGLTQHAGLAENVLDHRLNCRTVYMNRINRYLYWNMNYHLEHHMFPLVPYHALPRLHELVKHDCPEPYKSIREAFQEIIPTLLKQRKDVGYYAKRELPSPTIAVKNAHHFFGSEDHLKEGWIEVCPMENLPKGDILRFDFRERTYALYHTMDDQYYATDGICTHSNAHLSDGFIIGDQIECPKHNGRFSLKDGSAQRLPVCVGLKTYSVNVKNQLIFLNINKIGGAGALESEKLYAFKVVSNQNVATYIKELVLEPMNAQTFKYLAGEYIQFQIPPFEASLKHAKVEEPFQTTWFQENVFDYFAKNTILTRRNYSMATNPKSGGLLRFNVRLSLPPAGLNCSAGAGSTYIFNLREGDTINAFGPFGDFHIKESDREMVYVGGGAGMAPIMSHISYLFDTLKTNRKVSYWYSARSKRELFYDRYFESLAGKYENFSFHIVLSEPLPEDNWSSLTGYAHEALKTEYLDQCDHPEEFEYYLCGPPAMIQAILKVLNELKVKEDQISYDEF
jgi:Na+-transporting NADH:ubiquinone oxidoreductase subunit F